MDKSKLQLILFGLAGLAMLSVFLYDFKSYEYKPATSYSDFESFYKARLKISKKNNVRPGYEERFVRITPGKSNLAILFIHGFGGSRAEGEMVVDRVSRKYRANTYYLRLPGHGTTKEDHASVEFEDYMNTVEEAFSMMHMIGEKIVIIGSSTGGTLATWLASKYPDKVHAIILASPFYDFHDPVTRILDIPGGLALGKLAFGENRNADNTSPRKQPGYNDYWLTDQKYDALGALNKLQNFVNRDEIYRKITAPSLIFFYYKNEEQKDEVVSIDTILEALHKFGTLGTPDGKIHPSPYNRAVAVADGNHILLSKYVKTDKNLILREIDSFFEASNLAVGMVSKK